jgi:hypothetical protein
MLAVNENVNAIARQFKLQRQQHGLVLMNADLDVWLAPDRDFRDQGIVLEAGEANLADLVKAYVIYLT